NRQILLRIRLPVALRLTLPSVVNEAIMILKASSLVSVVGVEEVTRVAQNLSAVSFDFVPVFMTAGALYLVLNLGLTWLGGRVAVRLRTGRAVAA
ncbi:MAG: ABC transporter permease subunit, partial [Rhodospirillales bacterium]|nr:ABC transporter permease subunit [Rhodospirillales bacterium]